MRVHYLKSKPITRMSYASKFMSAKTAETPIQPTFSANNNAFSRNESNNPPSLFGARRPKPLATISEATAAANPWAARAAAANGIKVEEKLDLESEKQFPSLATSSGIAPKKGAWASSTVTAAALAADWAEKEAEEKAASEAEKQRREEEAAHQVAQRRQYTSVIHSRSDVFRQEVYDNNDIDDDYDDQLDDTYETRTYEINDEEQEWQQASSTW
jgi:hypothetical protein